MARWESSEIAKWGRWKNGEVGRWDVPGFLFKGGGCMTEGEPKISSFCF